MNEQEKYEYWLEHAQYDMKAAETMLNSGMWVYAIFMCQQATEKLVKGLYGLYLDFDSIPRVHNISRLINDFKDQLPQPITQELSDFFGILTRYYLNTRYPDYVEDLFEQTKEGNTKEIFAKTKEVFAWLQTLKP